MTNTERLLEKNGWTMECYSPLEICYDETGDRATGVAAKLIIELLAKEQEDDLE